MVEIHCIVNPASRDGNCGRQWPQISEQLVEVGFKVQTHLTKKVGHAGHIAWDLRQSRASGLIVAVGGDGTTHEVASALRGSDIPLGIIP